MPLTDDAKQTADRFKTYVNDLVNLFKKFEITGTHAPRQMWKAIGNADFRKEWGRVWREIAERDGGKLTLSTVFAIIGAVLGGVGIAAMGGAIGLPVAIVLLPMGYLIGSEFDSAGLLRKLRNYLTNTKEDSSDDFSMEGEQFIELLSTLLIRCEQNEFEIKEAREKNLVLDAKVVELEQSVSAFRSEILSLRLKIKYVLWIGGGICVVLGGSLIYAFIR